MTDSRKEGNDGFEELKEEHDPLTSMQLAQNKASPKSKQSLKDNKPDEAAMNEKLKNVFGDDIRFEDHPKKPTKPLKTTAVHSKDDSDQVLLRSQANNHLSAPQSNEHLRAHSKDDKKHLQEPVHHMKKHPSGNVETIVENTDKDQEEKPKMRYKDAVANSDEFDSEKIEAVYIDQNCKILGVFKLGTYMVG